MIRDLFDLEENRLREEILSRRAKRVFVQLPEGLKPEAPRLASIIEETGATAIVSADPCYGACDLPLAEVQFLGADLLIHYGHSERKLQKKELSIPILYLEAKSRVPISKIIKEALVLLEPWKQIGLATTVQHVHRFEEAKEILRKAGKTVYSGKAKHLKYQGQVLGCDYTNAKAIADKVEAFLFIGGGQFHALGLFLSTMKPTIVADPFENRVYPIESEGQKIIKRRWDDISKAKKAKTFGVLIGLKTGQINIEDAVKIRKDLEEHGKKACLFSIRELVPEALLQFPSIEAYVNTACPRITLEDSGFAKPVLTIKEMQVALGIMSWNHLLKVGFL